MFQAITYFRFGGGAVRHRANGLFLHRLTTTWEPVRPWKQIQIPRKQIQMHVIRINMKKTNETYTQKKQDKSTKNSIFFHQLTTSWKSIRLWKVCTKLPNSFEVKHQKVMKQH